MHTSILLMASVFFFAFAQPVWSDTHWDMAVRHFSDNPILPAKVSIEETLVGTKGTVEYHSTLESTLFRSADDTILFAPHSGYANGEEISKGELWKMSKSLREKELQTNPFTADITLLRLHQEKETRILAGHRCRCFSFSAEIDGHLADGTACLTEKSGLPVEAEWQYIDVPFKKDETTINSYTHKNFYLITEQGDCHILTSEISLSLEYTIFFVPYEGRLQRRISFADHRKPQDLPLHSVAGTLKNLPYKLNHP